MLVDWSDEFDRWLTNVEEEGGRRLEVATALLQALMDLPCAPAEESETFKRVRLARRHELWRVGHPYDPDVALRIVCWVPERRHRRRGTGRLRQGRDRRRVLCERGGTRRGDRRRVASPTPRES